MTVLKWEILSHLAIKSALIQLHFNMRNFPVALHRLLYSIQRELLDLKHFVYQVTFAELMPYWWNVI